VPYADAIGARSPKLNFPCFKFRVGGSVIEYVWGGKIKKHNNNNNKILSGSTRQQRQHLCAKSPAPPSFGDGFIQAVQPEQLLPLKLAFFPQVISCVGDISDSHSAFLQKRPACKTRSSNCYCFKPFVEHYHQFVFTKSVRCLCY
jgi:hypothetical protein